LFDRNGLLYSALENQRLTQRIFFLSNKTSFLLIDISYETSFKNSSHFFLAPKFTLQLTIPNPNALLFHSSGRGSLLSLLWSPLGLFVKGTQLLSQLCGNFSYKCGVS
jgi:hypothetical protein